MASPSNSFTRSRAFDMSTVFRLAHVTDPHFRGWAGLKPQDLFSKRLPGLANVLLRRRRVHSMSLLDALGDDLARRGFDHLVVTGDLSNVGLEGEWRAALAWLNKLGAAAEAITLIPGNHDAYSASIVASGLFERMFAMFQEGAGYPFVRIRGRLALIGLNSCEPPPPLQSWGNIGQKQLRALHTVLTSPELRSCARVVLIHHPPLVHRGGDRRNLCDRSEFLAVISQAGAELILHGHDHRDSFGKVSGPRNVLVPVIGAASASYAGRPEARARYNIYEISEAGITAITYGHDSFEGRFRELQRTTVAIGSPFARC